MKHNAHNGPITTHVRANGAPAYGPPLELERAPLLPNRHARRAAGARGRVKARALLAELARTESTPVEAA
jgi:hypothetical protein